MDLHSDWTDRIIHSTSVPCRIISLVPSQTELLFHLGLEDEVVGITKFCVHPKLWYTKKVKIGGTKNVNIEKIKLLKPDLILANKEENVKEQIVALKKIAPVWVSDVNSVDTALDMIHSVGLMVGKNEAAKLLALQIEDSFSSLEKENKLIPVTYLIWRNPYMTVGGDTFINDMLRRCGFSNVFEKENRYPKISLEQLEKCQLILLSSEPYPFKEIHLKEMQDRLPGKRILMVDGEMFSWYGSRMLMTPQYFKELINHINSNPANFTTLV